MARPSASNAEHPCKEPRKDGTPCTTPALPGSEYCFAHDPDLAAKRDAGRRKGGQGKATSRRLGKLMPARLVPIWDRLETALADTLDGSLDPRQATAAAALARALVAVLQAGEFEERLRKLEEAAP